MLTGHTTWMFAERVESSNLRKEEKKKQKLLEKILRDEEKKQSIIE